MGKQEDTADQIFNSDLYGGLANIQLEADRFDLGRGVTICTTFGHFMAPFMMAFAQAAPGKPHPAPWKAARGGLSFDMHAELRVPRDLDLSNFYDRFNTVWWIAALIRLKGCSALQVPVIADRSFSQIPLLKEEPRLWPVEINVHQFKVEQTPSSILNEPTLEWVRDHWYRAGQLMNRSPDLNVAFQAYDSSRWATTVPLALVSVWGALERLFSPARAELKFRVSANIAAFLEPPGSTRLALFKHVQKLYDARSAAAHGAGEESAGSFLDTCEVMRRVILQAIENDNAPTREDLDTALFGA